MSAQQPEVLPRLLADAEFIGALTRLKFPSIPAPIGRLVAPVVRFALRRELAAAEARAAAEAKARKEAEAVARRVEIKLHAAHAIDAALSP